MLPHFLIGLEGGSLICISYLLIGLSQTFKNASYLKPLSKKNSNRENTTLTIIVPTYNEENNIEGCLSSILSNEEPCSYWKVVLADDESTDKTIQIGQSLKEQLQISNNRLEIFKAGPRPKNEGWVGKNWACAKAMERINSDWVLFIDADVKLKKDALKRALNHAIEEEADLLSLAPKLQCGCIAEWMVQPIMACLLGLAFPIKKINLSTSQAAFAAGPFMLFKRASYEAIGGHKDVAGEVIEDLLLARKIKSSGFTLRYLLGLDAIEVRMYPDFASLWEGWSKNWFLGTERNIAKALSASFIAFLIFSVPWLALPTSFISIKAISNHQTLSLIAFGLSLINIGLQLRLRLWIRKEFDLPIKFWWLMSAGGVILLFLGPNSIFRSITGYGWTWKGRKLRPKNTSS